MELTTDVRAFIEARRVAHLGTTGADGQPHVVPVTFALLDDRIYSAVDEKPKRTTRLQRLRNLEANPRATLLFDVYDEDWTRLEWVMVRGTARAIDGGAEHAAAVAALRARYPQYAAMALEGRPVIRIEPVRVTRWHA